MRQRRLVYGDRPIGVALRPHLLDAEQFDVLTRRTEQVASALEKVAAAAVADPAVMDRFGLTELEREFALIDPGFARAAINTRMDGFVHAREVRFVEFNGENPSSLSDQAGLNEVLAQLPEMTALQQRFRLREFSPPERLLESLIATFREWGGSGEPQIAIVDWKDLPTANEFILLQEYFTSQKVRTIICSPEELEYEGGELRCGDFRIDLVYKRVIIHEFLERCGRDHALARAYRERRVCLVNPFRCKIMHKKASFELLTDEDCAEWFDAAEREAIQASVPWTRRVADRKTTWQGQKIELLDFVSRNREKLVLKPNDDYGGRGVFVGPRVEQGAWEDALQESIGHDYVVQEAIDLHTEEFPIFGETEWAQQPMFVDTNPFLFRGKVCGALVRLSESPVVNVTSGGGETGFYVIEGAR